MWPFRKHTGDDRLYRKVLDLEARLTELEAKHMSLRGRVYSAGIHKHPLPDSEEARLDTVPRSKDELRKQAGIKAGRPYPHEN
jgi:hypothetical protein